MGKYGFYFINGMFYTLSWREENVELRLIKQDIVWMEGGRENTVRLKDHQTAFLPMGGDQ